MSSNDSMLDIYIYENTQMLEELESLLLVGEKAGEFSTEQNASIMRILHTIKGSSAMMNFDSIANLTHAMEDLFTYLRDNGSDPKHHLTICDLSFQTLDTVGAETAKIQKNGMPDGDVSELVAKVKSFHESLTGDGETTKTAAPKKLAAKKTAKKPTAKKTVKPPAKKKTANQAIEHYYIAEIVFEADCKMENVRALGIVKSIEPLSHDIQTVPEDLLKENCEDDIIANGFQMYITSSENIEIIQKKLNEAFFVESVQCDEADPDNEEVSKRFGLKKQPQKAKNAPAKPAQKEKTAAESTAAGGVKQQYLSVNLDKLDKLMDLVGEIVITESTVTKNPEVLAMGSDSFNKASRQLRKLTDELQDIVMSIRMIPVSATFHKMERIVRDMSNKVGKKAKLTIIGEETELDKNVIDKLSDPLMHIVRNSMDHGLEPADERIAMGKDEIGEIVLEARNTSGNVSIIIKDDGRGLNKDALVKKGIDQGLITKPAEEVTDQEAYSLIFKSGLSTKKNVTEFSGRGVGMNVAMTNIEKIGGSVTVDSAPGEGLRVEIQIPLTLAIIDGMQVSAGGNTYIAPMLSIKESFKPNIKDVFSDPDGNEIIHLRGECYPIVRLHSIFNVETAITELENGILVLLETKGQHYCLFVDCLIGEQQTVVKPIPMYIMRAFHGQKRLAGCTILGDGSISLILDINGLLC